MICRIERYLAVSVLATVILASMCYFRSQAVNAAYSDDGTVANLDVNATITNACTDTVTMAGITGTGQSALGSNVATCNVKTNNSAGYSLVYKTSTANTYMASGANQIPTIVLSPDSAPNSWPSDADNSYWGVHLATDSTTADTATWGAANTYDDGKWWGGSATDRALVSRSTDTSSSGDDEKIYFGAEVGANKAQPSGTYTINVVVTATTI